MKTKRTNPGNPKSGKPDIRKRPTRMTGHNVLLWGVGIFAVALLVRLVYLYEIREIPLVHSPTVDARSYDEWGAKIASGEWIGDEVFYQAPAYPYFLGVVYAIAGHDLRAAHFIQMILGAFSCLLIYLAARRFFCEMTGRVSGILLALYTPAIFFDGLIQKAGLGLFLMALFLYLIVRMTGRPRIRDLMIGGFVAGLLALTRENMLLLLVLVPVWVVWTGREKITRKRVRPALLFLAGAALALLPVGVRNLSVGSQFALTTSQAGPNFFIGNNTKATGLYMPLIPGRQDPAYERLDAANLAEQALGRGLTPGEISDYWMGRGLDFVRSDPAAWFRLMIRKTLLTWNRFEFPDAEDLYAYAEWSSLLRVLGFVFHFGLLAPLGVAGILLTWSGRKRYGLFYALLVLITAATAIFYVFARYRFPLVPVLLPFAGAALVEGFRLIRMKQWRSLIPSLILFLAAAVLVNRPMVEEDAFRSISFVNLGRVCAESGRVEDADRFLTRALALYPENVFAHRELGLLRSGQGRAEDAANCLSQAASLDPEWAAPHSDLGDVLAGLGRTGEAIAHMREAIRLKPDDGETRRSLANLLRSEGMTEEAARELELLSLLEPGGAESVSDKGDIHSIMKRAGQLSRIGRYAEAIGEYKSALEIAPGNAVIHHDIARAYGASGDLHSAVEHYKHAVEIDPGFAEAHMGLGQVYGQTNEHELSVLHSRSAVEAKPGLLEANYNLAVGLAQMEEYVEAADVMERCLEIARSTGRADLIAHIEQRIVELKQAQIAP